MGVQDLEGVFSRQGKRGVRENFSSQQLCQCWMDSGLVRAQGGTGNPGVHMSKEMNSGELDKTDGGVSTRTRGLEFEFWHCYIWCLISRHEIRT